MIRIRPVFPVLRRSTVMLPARRWILIEEAGLAAEDSADRDEPIPGKSKRRQHLREEFHYVSSFDRLASKEPSLDTQPAPLRMCRYALKVLAVAAGPTAGARTVP